MAERVVFYRLSHKYVDSRDHVAPESKQIIYYSLAIGHHLGVVDCLSPAFEMEYGAFTAWVEKLRPGTGRRKLEGVLKWGEIEIGRAHTRALLETLEASTPSLETNERELSTRLAASLTAIEQEPALYLIARRQ